MVSDTRDLEDSWDVTVVGSFNHRPHLPLTAYGEERLNHLEDDPSFEGRARSNILSTGRPRLQYLRRVSRRTTLGCVPPFPGRGLFVERPTRDPLTGVVSETPDDREEERDRSGFTHPVEAPLRRMEDLQSV